MPPPGVCLAGPAAWGLSQRAQPAGEGAAGSVTLSEPGQHLNVGIEKEGRNCTWF